MKKVNQAYERAKPLRDELFKIGRCMEVTEDKVGILWERWLVNGTQVVVFSTPMFCDAFICVGDPTWEGTIKAILKTKESERKANDRR